MTYRRARKMFAVVFVNVVFAAIAWAQDTSTSTTSQSGPAQVTTEVRSGEVVYVSGDDLVVRMPDGQVKNFVVPKDFKFNVNGQDMTLHDLQPGMKLTRTITTTSTPHTVKTVRTIEGKVWHVNVPNTVVVTLPDGTNKTYTVPSGTQFNIEGQQKDVFSLKKGMKISATVITEAPEVRMSSTSTVTGEAPQPPPQVQSVQPAPVTPPLVGILLIEHAPPAPRVAPQETAENQLPSTASNIPLIGLLGLLCMGAWGSMRFMRSSYWKQLRGN
jgi:hypothetical protein